jgi:hypothetical protein
VALLAGCSALGDAREVFAQLAALQQQLETAMPGETIRVTRSTGGQLSVDLVNSKLATLPPDVRAARTRQIATLARQHFAGITSIQTISVVFVSQSRAAGFTLTTSDPTHFAVDDLDMPQPSATDSAPRTGTRANAAVAGATPQIAPGSGQATRDSATTGIKSVSRWKSF